MQPTFDRDILTQELRTLGIGEGDHLAVAMSLKSIGKVEGGAETFLEALLDAVGPGGTLMMNTFTPDFPLSEIKVRDYVYNRETTPSTNGIVSEALRNHPAAVRSYHPSISVTAVGYHADTLTRGHDEKASLYQPYSTLAGINGKMCVIGIGNNLVAIRHQAQYLAGLLKRVPMKKGVKYINKAGNQQIFVHGDCAGCTRRLPELVPSMIDQGILKEGRIGSARALFGSADQILASMTDTLREHPELNLCDNPFCLWCRELEKSLGPGGGRTDGPGVLLQRGLFATCFRIIHQVRMRKYKDGIHVMPYVKKIARNLFRYTD